MVVVRRLRLSGFGSGASVTDEIIPVLQRIDDDLPLFDEQLPFETLLRRGFGR
jgi:hypothetical protein